MMKAINRPYNAINVSFFILYPLLTLSGLVWYFSTHDAPWGTWVLTFVMLYGSGLGITAGYHRLYSHRSFDASPLVRLGLILWGTTALQGSIKEWSADHRRHHQFVDTEKDPYSIKEGFWHAHLGWILKDLVPARIFDNVKDLEKDPLVRFQHRYYFLMAFGLSIGLPSLLAWTWGDPWGGFFVAGWGRMFFNHHATFSINSFCHLLGSQPYSTKHSGRDSWITALLTYGEGYHNFHHEFPGDYRNGIRAYHWDPGKWLIRILDRFDLANNLHRAEPQKVLQARLKVQEEKILERLILHPSTVRERLAEMLSRTRGRLEEAHRHFIRLKGEYRRLKNEKIENVQATLTRLHEEIVKGQENLRQAWAEWRLLIQQPLLVAS